MNGSRLVLFLEQMEELFTGQNPEVANKFLTVLYEVSRNTPLRVIATIRSDHLHHLHDRSEMRQILDSKGHYPVGPIEPFMLSDMILKPAECAGLRVSETLARRIIHEMGTGAGNLPLLAFVLAQLFEKRSNHELSESIYNAVGGVFGAIKKHAAAVESSIQDKLRAKASVLFPEVFSSLVTLEREASQLAADHC